MMQRRALLATLAATAAKPPVSGGQQPARPNILFILADDLGYRDTGFQGGPIETPNLDRMARSGIVLEQAYSYPLCSPTRSALLTGRNPMRLGLAYSVVRPWSSYGLDPRETTIADIFRSSGYQTAICGKWHLGHTNRRLTPNARGFDHFYGHLNGAIDYFTHLRDGGIDWQRNGKTVREEGYTTTLLGREASAWITRRDPARPFFLYLPFNAPHSPLQAPQPLIDKYAGSIQDPRRRTFAAMVDALDSAVGEVMATVERLGLAQNTLVVFWSDNGGPRALGADNGPLRQGKATVFEGGLRVPALFFWPGTLAAGRSRQVMAIWDVLPTLAAAAGIPANTARPLDGVNVWQELRTGAVRPRENLFWAVHESAARQFALRDNQWKYVRIDPHEGAAAQDLLFDIVADPNEQQNLASAQPERVRQMLARVRQWAATHPKAEVFYGGGPHPGFIPPKDWSTLAVD